MVLYTIVSVHNIILISIDEITHLAAPVVYCCVYAHTGRFTRPVAVKQVGDEADGSHLHDLLFNIYNDQIGFAKNLQKSMLRKDELFPNVFIKTITTYTSADRMFYHA